MYPISSLLVLERKYEIIETLVRQFANVAVVSVETFIYIVKIGRKCRSLTSPNESRYGS